MNRLPLTDHLVDFSWRRVKFGVDQGEVSSKTSDGQNPYGNKKHRNVADSQYGLKYGVVRSSGSPVADSYQFFLSIKYDFL